MGTVDYLTDLANALEEFFKGLSECGLLTSYSVQLQVSSIDFVVQIKFQCLMYQFMKSLQTLLLKINIPGHENSHDVAIQTPTSFDSVFIQSSHTESNENVSDHLDSLVEARTFPKSVVLDWPDSHSTNDNKDHSPESFSCSNNQTTTFVVQTTDNDTNADIIVTCDSAALAVIAEQNLVSSDAMNHTKLDLSDTFISNENNQNIVDLESIAENNLNICESSTKSLNISKEFIAEIGNSDHINTEDDPTEQSELKSLGVDVSPLILKTYVEEEMLDVSENINVMHFIVASENIDDKPIENNQQKGEREKKKPFKCKNCDKSFTTVQSLDLHLNRKHIAKEQCNMCSRSFSSIQSLQEHCKLDHGGVGCFNCLLCNRRFMTKLSYKRHMDTHVGKKEAVCDICGKTFSRTDYLNKHYMTHSGTRPLSCSQCPRKFISSSHLKNHEKTHTGEREHNCKFCTKSFSRADKLREHTLRHLNVKRFECAICKRTYAEKRDLTKHLRIH